MALEPYKRMTYGGRVLNRRTAAAVDQWGLIFHLLGGKSDLHVAQGSYNDGGGAVDITVDDQWELAEYAGRLVGFADWHRLPTEGPWSEHVHGILIGDKEMSPSAAKQVCDYYAGLNGLANHARDTSPRPSVITPFHSPLQNVNLVRLREQTLTNTHAIHAVRVVQRVLNEKTGARLTVDGRFGPITRAAYGRFEKQVNGDGDGLPSLYALTLLGAARFNVKEK